MVWRACKEEKRALSTVPIRRALSSTVQLWPGSYLAPTKCALKSPGREAEGHLCARGAGQSSWPSHLACFHHRGAPDIPVVFPTRLLCEVTALAADMTSAESSMIASKASLVVQSTPAVLCSDLKWHCFIFLYEQIICFVLRYFAFVIIYWLL